MDSEEASCILRSQRGAYTRLAQLTLLAYNVSISVLYGTRKNTHFYATAGHHRITPTKAIADYERKLALAAEQAEKDAATIKELQAKLAEASVEAVKASEASAKLSADSAVSALEATKLILARAQSLEASREAVPDDAKKAASLDGF